MRKSRNGRKAQIDELSKALLLNGEAKAARKKKQWSVHDLKRIIPLTLNQATAFDEYRNKDHIILNGSAGTGKTYLHIYHALQAIISEKSHDKIIIFRSAVPSRDQGFLPGSIDEKSAPFEEPYSHIFTNLLGKASSYQDMKDAGLVEFRTTGYLRGLTFDDAIVIVDEAQNMSFHEINTLVTRMGENTRLFVSADSAQNDLKKSESGYLSALKVWQSMDEFSVITFSHDDIVRSGLVKAWIIKCDELKVA